MRSIRICLVLSGLLCTFAHAVAFHIAIDPQVGSEPVSGRLVVYVLRDNIIRLRKVDPVDNVFYSPPRPMYGLDIRDLAPGSSATVDDSATWFLKKASELPPGKYHAQAVLDRHRENSEWNREPGNLFSDPVAFEVKHGASPVTVKINLDQVVKQAANPDVKRVEVFSIRSKLLSDFHRRDVVLRAGVVLPESYDPNRSYPAVYEVPGFGGDYRDAFPHPRRVGRMPPEHPSRELARNSFWIVLDPESGNGHTLFCDSDVNGPWGRALTQELIPALEAKFPLIAQPSARLLRGHSSGGWATLWLATEHPKVFGATWSSSPDPVSFHRFEHVDLYDWDNFYYENGKPTPSYRRGRTIILDVFEENGMEEVVGPDNTSGQQWDAWMSCWGRRNESGNAAALYDPYTGKIDRAEAETYRRFDITERLKRNPQKYGPIFLQRVRLICGAADNFYLNEAVELLKAEIDKLDLKDEDLPEGSSGYVVLVPGADHGTVFLSKEIAAIPAEMLRHLRAHSHLPATNPATRQQ
jgi:hypothetical protein